MGDLLAWWGERDPDRIAVICGDESVTYPELDRRANRLAHAYRERGVGVGDLVGIALPNSVEFYAAAFAAWKLGATPQPLSHRLPEPERAALIDLGEPALVVGVDAAAARGRPSVPAGFDPGPGVSADPVPAVVGPSFKAMASGGSTGRPKLIVASVPTEFDPDVPAVQMEQGDVQLVPGPLYHNGPFSFSMFGLFVGSTLVVLPRFDAAEALRCIDAHRVTWVFFVPTMMHRIWNLPERQTYDVSSLRQVFSTGAPWPVWLKEGWIDWLGPDRIREGYGGTEGQGGTSITGTESLTHPGSVGLPQGGCGMRILDEHGREVPTGEVGEVYFMPATGPGTTYRYLGAEAKAHDGWETIGDLGSVDDDGYLYLVDRRTDMVVTGGANVFPAEVEAAIEAFAGVRSCAVIGLPDDDLGQRVHAIVDAPAVPADGAGSEAELFDALRVHLHERIAPYKVPRSFELASEPLRDDAGKVRRSALRDARR
ncbi:MAG: AMP-binding protein [Acidimicrobiia bacterium]|jgi:bile acid-coenzyme A ligase